MYCVKCGSKNSDELKFCTSCGASLPIKKEKIIEKKVVDREHADNEFKLAGFWIRLGAFLIDYVIGGLGGAFMIGVIVYGVYPESTFIDNLTEVQDGLSTFLFVAIYHSISLSLASTTIGKKIFGLKVVDQGSKKKIKILKAIIRSFSYFLSSLFFAIGFIMVATDKKNHQGLHDKIAKTLVIRKVDKKPIIGIIVSIVAVVVFVYFTSDYFIVKNTVDDITPSVANIYCPFASEGMYLDSDGYGGSGTVMTSDGMVLTNSHVIPQTDDYIVTPEEGCFVILYNPETGEDDIYLAEPIVIPEISEEYDLAYLSIYDVYVDEEGAWGEYPKNFISFDDSMACDNKYIDLGDEIRIYGYPVSSGGLSLTVTDGIVSSLPGDGTLLTSAKIDSGNSGGIAVDYNGCMIGVPAAVSEGKYENMGVIISTDLIYEFEDKLALYLEAENMSGKEINGEMEYEIDLTSNDDYNFELGENDLAFREINIAEVEKNIPVNYTSIKQDMGDGIVIDKIAINQEYIYILPILPQNPIIEGMAKLLLLRYDPSGDRYIIYDSYTAPGNISAEFQYFDFNNDGQNEIIAYYTENYGGSGSATYMEVYRIADNLKIEKVFSEGSNVNSFYFDHDDNIIFASYIWGDGESHYGCHYVNIKKYNFKDLNFTLQEDIKSVLKYDFGDGSYEDTICFPYENLETYIINMGKED
ncbi:MAG: RDD family protein [Patescibacteria group bacterium]